MTEVSRLKIDLSSRFHKNGDRFNFMNEILPEDEKPVSRIRIDGMVGMSLIGQNRRVMKAIRERGFGF